MLGLFISTHDTYLHAWGSILIQDVILPFRKKPLSPSQHLWLLRLSVMGVAVFIFCFSLLFEHAQYISMFLTITGAIFAGGAGAVIIGGLYWDRGTTAGAWSALLVGGGVATVGVVVKQITDATLDSWAATDGLHTLATCVRYLKENVTGQEMTFYSMIAAIACYVGVSLLGPGGKFSLDRLLHRGEYAIAGETATSFRDARSWWERLGFTRDFTGADKIVTYVTVSWPLVVDADLRRRDGLQHVRRCVVRSGGRCSGRSGRGRFSSPACSSRSGSPPAAFPTCVSCIVGCARRQLTPRTTGRRSGRSSARP